MTNDASDKTKWWTCGKGHVFTFGDEKWHWEREQNQGVEDGFPVPRFCVADVDGEPCMDSTHLIYSDTQEEAEKVAEKYRPKPRPSMFEGPGVAIISDADYDGWPVGMPKDYLLFDSYDDYQRWSRLPGSLIYGQHVSWQKVVKVEVPSA